MQNYSFVSGCDDKLFLQKCELWVEVSPRIMRTSIQDPLHFFGLMGHRVQKLLIFDDPNKYCVSGKLNIHRGCNVFLITDKTFFHSLQPLP